MTSLTEGLKERLRSEQREAAALASAANYPSVAALLTKAHDVALDALQRFDDDAHGLRLAANAVRWLIAAARAIQEVEQEAERLAHVR